MNLSDGVERATSSIYVEPQPLIFILSDWITWHLYAHWGTLLVAIIIAIVFMIAGHLNYNLTLVESCLFIFVISFVAWVVAMYVVYGRAIG